VPNSAIVKRSISIRGRKTSISLEEVFWQELKAISNQRRWRVSEMISFISAQDLSENLSSAIRICIMQHHRARSAQACFCERMAVAQPGHQRTEH